VQINFLPTNLIPRGKRSGNGTNGLVTPVNQIVTPAGIQIDFAACAPNALALSPNGKFSSLPDSHMNGCR